MVHPLASYGSIWSEEKSESQIDDATNKPMVPRYSHYPEVLVKQDGTRLIADSMVMDEYRDRERSISK
jgi:hypothetical protein